MVVHFLMEKALAGIAKTALIYVGNALQASEQPLGKESKLYDKDFKHEYRTE